MSDLASLRRLSARLGRDLDLIQAGGATPPLKDRGTLCVKAAGAWLARRTIAARGDPAALHPDVRERASIWDPSSRSPNTCTTPIEPSRVMRGRSDPARWFS
jgi:hypothetical protein